MRVITFVFALSAGFKLEKSDASSFLSRAQRNYELTVDFESACIESHCDVVTFFEVYFLNF